MKIIINSDYGGWSSAPDHCREICHPNKRTDPKAIEFVEQHPDECGDLKVVDLPDETTDYVVDEYDGKEVITYVVDGLLHWEE